MQHDSDPARALHVPTMYQLDQCSPVGKGARVQVQVQEAVWNGNTVICRLMLSSIELYLCKECGHNQAQYRSRCNSQRTGATLWCLTATAI